MTPPPAGSWITASLKLASVLSGVTGPRVLGGQSLDSEPDPDRTSRFIQDVSLDSLANENQTPIKDGTGLPETQTAPPCQRTRKGD